MTLTLAGCAASPRPPRIPANEAVNFASLYKEKQVRPKKEVEVSQAALSRVTIDAKNMPVPAFLSVLAQKFGVSIIADKELYQEKISLTVDDMPLDDVLQLVARQLDTACVRKDKIFYLGKLVESDNAFFVGFCPRLVGGDAENAIASLVSNNGKIKAFSDGLVIVSDNAKVLENIGKLVDILRHTRSDSWIVQFQFVVFRESDLADIGLTANANFNLSLLSVGDSSSAAEIGATLNKAIDQGKARLVSQPLMVLENGQVGKLNDGEEVPIPQKTVSDQGTVTVTGVTYKNTGTNLQAKILDMGNGSARLSSTITINSISGYNGDYPIVKGQTIEFQNALEANKVYLVAALNQRYAQWSKSKSLGGTFSAGFEKQAGATKLDSSGAFSFGRKRSQEQTDYLLQIWVRVYRIADFIDDGQSVAALPAVPVVVSETLEDATAPQAEKETAPGPEPQPADAIPQALPEFSPIVPEEKPIELPDPGLQLPPAEAKEELPEIL